MKVLISAKAKQDLLRIYLYLVERNPLAATATLKRIDARLAQLARFPFIGRERSSLAPRAARIARRQLRRLLQHQNR
jgi:plasmid stabilization system protein ParE